MFDKLEALEERFQLVSEKISDPDIIADQESWRKYCKEHSDLTPIIDKYRELKSAKQTVADDKEMLDAGQDKEFEEMIRLEMAEAEEIIERASDVCRVKELENRYSKLQPYRHRRLQRSQLFNRRTRCIQQT